mmetsp:Transcript_6039/g.6600  ORF Transcript_6039/g.6600 Transcript_6039/m.6600 type:complete len:111 (-) Transcript_6039:43-375(-)
MTDPFYCKICDKRFKSTTQLDTHEKGYAHNHRKRLADLREFDGQMKKTQSRKRQLKSQQNELERALKKAKATEEAMKILAPSPGDPEAEKEPEVKVEALKKDRPKMSFSF